jgi:hypothetical protein
LVGISENPDPATMLAGPPTDVSDMRKVLVDTYKFPAQNVRILRDQQATRQAIIDSIRRHLGRAGANGTAFLYFAGHGVQMSRNYSVQDPEGSGADQALLVWGPSGRGSVILDDEMGYLLRELDTPRVIFMADACHSEGAAQFGAKASGSNPPRFTLRSAGVLKDDAGAELPAQWLSDGVAAGSQDLDAHSGPFLFLAAAEEELPAWSAENWPPGQNNGVFTYYFTRALRTADGNRTAQQFFNGLQAQVVGSDACTTYGYCQTPQILGAQAGAQLVNLIGSR